MEIPKITALVPMKGHSERVPHKNIRPLVGKPAFHWIMETLSNSPYITEILVNTDSKEIAESASANFPKVKVLERPDFLLGDMVSIQPLIAYDIEQTDAQYFLQTHSTNPLLTVESINKAIETFFAQKEHDALFSVTPVQTRYYWANGDGINHDPKHLIRTQDLEPIYEENSCFYIFSKETNHKVKNRLGSKPLMFPIHKLEAADIDNMEDFYWCEFLLQRKSAEKQA
jgi:N-acylneuraminate cytidylyltransferase